VKSFELSKILLITLKQAMALQKILLILFPGFNTLDMNGPYEILQKANNGNTFQIIVASETEITTSQEGAAVKVPPFLFLPRYDQASLTPIISATLP